MGDHRAKHTANRPYYKQCDKTFKYQNQGLSSNTVLRPVKQGIRVASPSSNCSCPKIGGSCLFTHIHPGGGCLPLPRHHRQQTPCAGNQVQPPVLGFLLPLPQPACLLHSPHHSASPSISSSGPCAVICLHPNPCHLHFLWQP